jgi:hypothetical protein
MTTSSDPRRPAAGKRKEDFAMNMTPEEAAAANEISRLVAAIDAVEPHIAVLHLRIINHGCEAAWSRLALLGAVADRMIEEIHREDFMHVAIRGTRQPLPLRRMHERRA